MEGNGRKKLRKLPHVFGKVLELPFGSDADVAVEDWPDYLRFVADGDVRVSGGVRAQAVEIHPGVIKVVVRSRGSGGDLFLHELKVDTWRIRLPPSAQPELTTAEFVDGELIVTVPKCATDGREIPIGSRLVLV